MDPAAARSRLNSRVPSIVDSSFGSGGGICRRSVKARRSKVRYCRSERYMRLQPRSPAPVPTRLKPHVPYTTPSSFRFSGNQRLIGAMEIRPQRSERSRTIGRTPGGLISTSFVARPLVNKGSSEPLRKYSTIPALYRFQTAWSRVNSAGRPSDGPRASR